MVDGDDALLTGLWCVVLTKALTLELSKSGLPEATVLLLKIRMET